MPLIGVNMAVLQDGKILLTRREDFEVWCLPGGGVEDGESLGEAALREVKEETGLAAKITRLVGIYSVPDGPLSGLHLVTFAGEIVGGSFRPDPAEVVEMRFFGLEEIPPEDEFDLDSRQHVLDIFAGLGGSTVVSTAGCWPFEAGLVREEIYRMRDESELPRQDYYRGLLKGRNREIRREV